MRWTFLAVCAASALLAASAPGKPPGVASPDAGCSASPDAGVAAWFWRDVPFSAVQLVESRATAEGTVLTVRVGPDFSQPPSSFAAIDKLQKLHPEPLELREGQCVGQTRMCFLRESYWLGGKSYVFRTPTGAEEARWNTATGGDFPEIPKNVSGTGRLLDGPQP